uniref:Diguanylate cyclase/phosphodiesterase with PAS/PAC sensor(S) n=1 Tax=Rhodopseudomonas palustris (strain BisA53) TaxID=316055 RepID=Q07J74_RHOP5
MTGRKSRTGGKSTMARIAAIGGCVVAGSSAAAAATALTPVSYIGSFDAQIVWESLIGGFIVLSFLASIALWTVSTLRRTKEAHRGRDLLVSSALNSLGQGIVMIDAKSRVIFCNDRYLEIYGLTRSEVRYGMSGLDLLELRRARGTLDQSAADFYRDTGESAEHICDLPSGRSILIKFSRLPNGGSIATHDDCTGQRELSRQLATTKQFLESVIDNIPVCVAAKAIEDGRYILANRAFERFAGMSREQMLGKRPDEIFPEPTAAAVTNADKAAIESRHAPLHVELNVLVSSGTRVIESNRVVACNDKNEPEFLIALFDDITEKRELSRELVNAKKFLERVIDNVPICLTVQSAVDGRYLLANRSAETILNRLREDAIGRTVAEIFDPQEGKLIAERDAIAIKRGQLLAEEQPISTKDGLRMFVTRRQTVLDEFGEPQYLIKTHEDVTDQRQTEARMAHMAYHDGLTELPNRAAFLQALTQMIEACCDTADEFAVLSVDLDGLKEINDVFGHAVGDKLLIEVAERIKTASRGGVVSRLSGDEFGLIIDGPQPSSALDLADEVARAVGEGFQIDGKAMRIGVTTGIATFPNNGQDAASLLANAGAALFRAKAKMRGSVSIYEPEMDQQIRDRRVLHQDLSKAIKNGEISLYYQPQARGHGQTGHDDITGFEALARWRHPTRGFVPPSDFIPLAEESGLIVELGEWILREACREAASWAKPLQVAVNLSPAQFLNSDLVSAVHRILLETGLKPSRLELEITEGVLIEDFDRGLSLLRRLTSLGVKISMDDFGSGYSSLTYLQAFPFDKIKIDRAFVMNLGHNPQSAAIVRAVIGLGHGLGVSIVAEGVETQQQLDFLVQEGCDAVQGYFIGRPHPIEHYARLVGAPQFDSGAARMIG